MMKLVVGAAVVLVVAGGIAFYLASQSAQRNAQDKAADAVTVTVTGKACEPNALVVPAGRTTFRIVNTSDRAVEWEILDGVMVIDERENIAPGFTQTLATKLAPGTYAITCGLLSNPRGTLEVTPTPESASEAAAAPTPVAFIAPLAEYKVYLALQTRELVDATRGLSDAIKAGDLDEAKTLYAPARQAYKRMQPVVERIGDLDVAIDARADYFEQRERDPGFTGFHRIEYGLFALNSTDGLDATAETLLANVTSLRQRLRDVRLTPDILVSGAARVIAMIAQQKVSGDDNRYSHTDLADFQATLEGSRKIVDLLRPLVMPTNPALMEAVEARFTAIETTLTRDRTGDGFVSYDQLDPDDRAEIAQQMQALADEIAQLNTALGLS